MNTYTTVLTRVAYFSLGVLVGILLYISSTQQTVVTPQDDLDEQQAPGFTTQSVQQAESEQDTIDTAAISAALVERERARSYASSTYDEQARLLQELEERVATASLSAEQETDLRDQIETLRADQDELNSLIDELDREIINLQAALDSEYEQAKEVIDGAFDQ